MKNFSFILDNALEEKVFCEYKNYLQNSAVYSTIEADDTKKFYVTPIPYGLQEKITEALQKVWNQEIKIVLATVRKATQYLDKEWGIHSDLYVGSEEVPEYGAVLYMSQNDQELNGTALWRHKKFGYQMPRDWPKEEVIEISEKDYNDIDKWELSSVIGGIENRLVSYPSEYFHSKFPKQAWGVTQQNCRIVCALFYSIIK